MDNQTELDKDLSFMKCIVICKTSGEYLIDLIFDSKINPMLLSSFAGALSLFGKDNLGKIKEINIKGLSLEMIIVSKYNLILIAILDKNYIKKSIRTEAEKALDMFYLMYEKEINDFGKCIETSTFEDFKKILKVQIEEYLERIRTTEEEVKDFGFFTQAIEKLKKD
ncbi:MAG: hypothetical protein GF353_10180 [Candidatus Lokiarchaeota archaeon]|nr:hypothetical protein [Candidatus Lokiarchaeota archaeon]